ncbi:YtxH domain-containing protein [Domibacillus sp. 8LH]|uniref:YtxH domain-containing protein n=1 Tax=Domibacillus sp. 8LH TaxID=3073900 RepID=UPI00317C4DC3
MRTKNTYDQFNIKKNGVNSPQYPIQAQPQYDSFDLSTDRYDYEESMNTKDFVTGAIFGAVVGAAAALVLAPKSGTELRSSLNSQAGSLKERASGLTDTAKDKTSSLTSAVQEKSSALMDKVKSMKSSDNADSGTGTMNLDSASLDEKKEDAKSVVDSVAEAVKDKVDTTADTAKTKLDETKKAFDEAEKAKNNSNQTSSNTSSNTSTSTATVSSTTASTNATSAGWVDPADKGINEKKKNGGLNNNNNNNNNSNRNNNNSNKKFNNK